MRDFGRGGEVLIGVVNCAIIMRGQIYIAPFVPQCAAQGRLKDARERLVRLSQGSVKAQIKAAPAHPLSQDRTVLANKFSVRE
jgi:hypothetical protein